MSVSTIPTIWGRFEGYSDLYDIGLVPVYLTDKTTVLSGINMKEKRMEFYFPVVNINNNFPRSILILNRKEALIAVFSDLSTLMFYKLKRPN